MAGRGASVDSYGSPRKGGGLRSATNHAREVDDDAATETGSITGSTVQGSVVEIRIGTGIEGSALANLSNAPGVALTGFNAISTVLNHPTKRSNPIDPKSSRYPPLPLSHSELPTFRKADHASYVAQMRPEWDRFVRSQRLGRHGKARLGAQDDLSSSTEDDNMPMEEVDAPESSAAGAARFSIDSRRGQSTPVAATSRSGLPSLEAVPRVYFEEDFSLSSPHVFRRVVEQEASKPSTPAGEVAPKDGMDQDDSSPELNQMLQEKLSYYSDVIEQHLIVEIGARSSSFFAALGNLQELSAEAESCLQKVDSLKVDLIAVDEQHAKRGLELIVRQAKRREMEGRMRAVQAVRELVERRDMVKLLVQQGEFEEALDLMESIRMLLKRRHSDSGGNDLAANGGQAHQQPLDIDFSKVPAIASIVPGFSEHDRHIATALQQELVSILRSELQSRLTPPEQPPAGVNAKDIRALRAHKRKSMNLSLSIAAGQLNANGSKGLFEEDNQARTDTVQRLPKPPASRKEMDTKLRQRLSGLIFGLVRTKGVEAAFGQYRELSVYAIQEVVRSHLAKHGAHLASLVLSDEPLTEERLASNPTADELRALSHFSFLEMGHTFFEGLLECLNGISSQTRTILSLLHDFAHQGDMDGPRRGSANGSGLANDFGLGSGAGQYDMPEGISPGLPTAVLELIHSAGEFTHSCVARLITIRAAEHAVLPLRDFLAVFQLCWSFVLRSELTCKRMIMGLRGTVLNQAKTFLVSFHHKRVASAAKAVEDERWDLVEVDAQLQSEITRIVNSATEDPPEFIVSTEEDEDAEKSSAGTQDTNGSEVSKDVVQPGLKSKTLKIESRDYYVVRASIDMLNLLGEYLRVVVNLPLLTTEAMSRVVEFLKQFNSRTCQVVLGAGAMRSAGLKNITAKHLALASQSLSVVISLIPYIRETVRRHLSARQAVMLTEFDKLKRDYQEHQYEIHAKLVAIMSDRLTVHCRSLRAVDWNSESTKPDAEANQYMLDLVKETTLLYKVLFRYLPPATVEHVMSQVLSAIDKRTAADFMNLDIFNEEAKARIVKDIEYLNSKMGTMKGLTWASTDLSRVIKEKNVPPPQREQPPEPPTPRTPASAGMSYQPRIPSLRFGRGRGTATPPPSAPANMAHSQQSAAKDAQSPPRPSHDPPRSAMPFIGQGAGLVENQRAASPSGRAVSPQPPSVPGKANELQMSPPPTPAKDTPMASEMEKGISDAPANTQPETSAALPEPSKVNEEEEAKTPKVETTPTEAAPNEAPATSAPEAITEPPDSAQADTSIILETASEPPTPQSAVSQLDSPSDGGNATPTRPGRMSLQQRLAEATRKRALQAQQQTQQQQPSPSQEPTQPKEADDTTPSTLVKAETEEASKTEAEAAGKSSSSAESSSANPAEQTEAEAAAPTRPEGDEAPFPSSAPVIESQAKEEQRTPPSAAEEGTEAIDVAASPAPKSSSARGIESEIQELKAAEAQADQRAEVTAEDLTHIAPKAQSGPAEAADTTAERTADAAAEETQYGANPSASGAQDTSVKESAELAAGTSADTESEAKTAAQAEPEVQAAPEVPAEPEPEAQEEPETSPSVVIVADGEEGEEDLVVESEAPDESNVAPLDDGAEVEAEQEPVLEEGAATPLSAAETTGAIESPSQENGADGEAEEETDAGQETPPATPGGTASSGQGKKNRKRAKGKKK